MTEAERPSHSLMPLLMRFSADSATIRRLMLCDEGFRTLGDDYVVAPTTLHNLQKPVAPTPETVSEYVTRLRELDHLPPFIAGPGESDVLLNAMIVLVIGAVLMVGNLYLQLHSYPERMAHRANRVQLEIVAVLCLLALFTHQHLFWIAALLLAMVQFPDFSTPLNRIADS